MAKKEGYYTNIHKAQSIFRNITAGTEDVVSQSFVCCLSSISPVSSDKNQTLHENSAQTPEPRAARSVQRAGLVN